MRVFHRFPGALRAFLTVFFTTGMLAMSPALAQPQGGGLSSTTGVDQRQLLGEPDGKPLGGEALDQLTESVASKMRCPVCQGLSVADSRTVSALAMKGEVRDFLAEGYSEDQVLDYFERSYGEFIRLEPKAEGFNLVVWVLPIAFILIGLGLVVVRMRRPRDTAPDTDASLVEYRERVRRDLAAQEVDS